MKILIYSDNEWVIESVEKYIDFEYDLMKNIDFEDLNERIDFILVDMQVKNNGGPSIIKELKRQIEPRENEIADMAQQIKEMDQELEQYHKSNAALDLMIGELRLKMEGMQVELDEQKLKLKEAGEIIASFSADLHSLYQDIDSYKRLKVGITKLYKKNVQDSEVKQSAGNKEGKTGSAAAQQEFNRQREYLEKSVESLKRKLAKDMELHRADNVRLMRESVVLTGEINQLRRELRIAKAMRSKSNPTAPQTDNM